MATTNWTPNEEQARAVGHGQGPLRILAGAGSGKTTTLVQRIISLAERGLCRADQILMLTFTTKAAEDIRAKVAARLGTDGDQPRVETYHAFAWSLVREFADRLGLQPDPALLTSGQLHVLARQHIDRLGLTTFDLTRPGAAVQAVLQFADWMRHEGAHLRPPGELTSLLDGDPDLERWLDLLQAYGKFEALLAQKNAVDYGAQIALAVRLLEEHPDVRAEVSGRHPFLLVDEYQDTDHLQGRLIRLLAGDGANITVVGDPDQTIHGFRGATMTNIEAFDRDWPGTEKVAMVTNYRSTPEIVAVGNAGIAGNLRRKADSLKAHRGSGARPLIAQAADWAAEARWIAGTIAKLHGEGFPFAGCAILVRKNKHKLPLFAALLRAGIPVEVVGGLDLFDDPDTVRCTQYLQAVADPADDGAMSVALTMPRYGLTDRDVAALARTRTRGERLIDAAVRGAAADARLQLFVSEFWPLYARQFSEGCLSAIAGAVTLHATAMGAEGRVNAEQLIHLAEAFFTRPDLFVSAGSGLGLFLEYLQALRDADESFEQVRVDLGREAVKLMTVHQAKGLEFPVVFVPRLTERDFAPDGGRWEVPFPLIWHHDAGYRDQVAQMLAEEERRLFYVAVTRAMDRLYLSWAPRLYRGKPTARSPFLDEVAAACDAQQVEAPAEEVAVGLDAALSTVVSDAPARPVVASGDAPVGAAPLPEVLSFSHLHTYQLCPYRFYLQYILRAPGRPNRAADEGVRVHAAIELHGGAGGSFEAFASTLGLPVESEHVELEAAPGGVDPLRAYWESEYARTPAHASEAEFYLRLGGAVVHGFIDRIHRRPSDGVVEVVDFKTYNRLMARHEVKAGLQLPLYILGARQALGLPDVTDGAIFFLKHGEIVRVSYTEAELADRVAEAGRLVEAIRAREFGPAPGAVCRYCPYREVCPAALNGLERSVGWAE